jgi:hypothetical protein
MQKNIEEDILFFNISKHLEYIDLNEVKNPILWHQIVSIVNSNINRNKIEQYYLKRNIYNSQIKNSIDAILIELHIMFKTTNININEIKLMSSYSAATNIYNASDVDIGIIIENMDEEKNQIVSLILIANGYSFTKYINNYYCYTKILKINNYDIEIEVKVRDLIQSMKIIQLHDYLDNECDEEQKLIFTYIKYKLHGLRKIFPNAYKFIKMLFYNISLLQMDPNCKEFMTNF